MNRNSKSSKIMRKSQPSGANAGKPARKVQHTDSTSSSSFRNSPAESEEDFGVDGNYKRQSGSCGHADHESAMKKYKAQIKACKRKLRHLEECIDNRDDSLEAITLEKDKAMGEARRLEISNKQLKQQLSEERNHYIQEKEKFCTEMTKFKRKVQDYKALSDNFPKQGKPAGLDISKTVQQPKWQAQGKESHNDWPKSHFNREKDKKTDHLQEKKNIFSVPEVNHKKSNSVESLHLYGGDDVSLQIAALRTENAKLRSIICERDERNYELCLRFLRMKQCKNELKDRFQDLENEYLQVIKNLMEKIDDARQEFNFIIGQKFKGPIHSTNAAFLQLVQRNSRLAYENADLKWKIQCLKRELNQYLSGIKDYVRKSKSVDMESENDKSLSDMKPKKQKKIVNSNKSQSEISQKATNGASDTDSNYISRTPTTEPSSMRLLEPKSEERIVAATSVANLGNSTNQRKTQINSSRKVCKETLALYQDLFHHIFKKEESTGTSDLINFTDRTNQCESPEPPKPAVAEAKTTSVIYTKETDQKKKKPPRFIPPSAVKKQSQQAKPRGPARPASREKNKESSGDENKREPHPVVKALTENKSTCMDEKDVKASAYERWKEIQREYSKPKNLRSPRSSVANKSNVDKKISFRNSSLQYRVSGDYFTQQKDESLICDKMTDTRDFPPTMRESGDTTEGVSQRFRKMDGKCNVKIDKEKFEELITKGKEIQNRKKEELKQRQDISWKVCTSSSEDCTSLSRPNSECKLKARPTLHDELMEFTKTEIRQDDPFWQREISLHSLLMNQNISTAQTYRVVVDDQQRMSRKSSHWEADNKKQTEEIIVGRRRKSPEDKRRNDGDVKTKAEPRKHGRTIAAKDSSQGYSSSEVVRFLFKPPTEKKAVPLRSSESSGSYTRRVRRQPSDTSSLNFHLRLSDLPTSSSTMEMVESSVNCESSTVMVRTLSAPGLLESEWIDRYYIREMKDCSTNT